MILGKTRCDKVRHEVDIGWISHWNQVYHLGLANQCNRMFILPTLCGWGGLSATQMLSRYILGDECTTRCDRSDTVRRGKTEVRQGATQITQKCIYKASVRLRDRLSRTEWEEWTCNYIDLLNQDDTLDFSGKSNQYRPCRTSCRTLSYLKSWSPESKKN